MAVLLPKDIDLDKIVFGAPKQNTNGGSRFVPLSYNGRPLIFQTPRMPCAYGLSKWGEGQQAKYSLDLSFKETETNTSVKKFKSFLESLDEFMIKKGFENSVEWLKKKCNSEDIARERYTESLRYAKDKDTHEITDKYPPTFRLNNVIKDGKPSFPAYDVKANPLEWDKVVPNFQGAFMTAIVRCTSIWLGGGNYGLIMRVEQLRVEANPAKLHGFAFRDDEDNVVASDDEDCPEASAKQLIKPMQSAHIDTSDDEEEEEEDVEEPVEPVVIDEPVPEAPAAESKTKAKRTTKK